ncbi:hypothetical protein TVAG_043100 [Trichomonas vaginalis G3]|uniref:Uncharacterized protein n=1 Tax=Trichomonas vaginalis (strain ATCC PRA-98 / G3) TaxID=412133 RepID=A2F6S4_TRIV3|nr:hypothetical protein TVAGG3_0701500 [Trichomonas vaginalis G3]EAX99402.1 hypothetical protein TVAG_043100 [Trichomonas vaginalis G3]KAI5509271.1 hypothetical protein TVAGG3_0701500 [Trichomonas vaginalis G3]|eukprot:XP_001312332.1 hypothetical protein [Trichomonas vaginalis G3]
MKNFGNRTLVGNWWEERQNLQEYTQRTVDIKDMTVDLHVSARDKNPALTYNDKTPVASTYKLDTDQAKISQMKDLKKKVAQAERRKLAMGSTQTATRDLDHSKTFDTLNTRFYDPNKTRFKTVYQKSYNIPEFELIRSQRELSSKPTESFRNAQSSTIDLSWN